MGLPQRIRKLTPAEYLDIERAAAYRSEYFDGGMFAMAGGSPRHSLISVNICGEIRAGSNVRRARPTTAICGSWFPPPGCTPIRMPA